MCKITIIRGEMQAFILGGSAKYISHVFKNCVTLYSHCTIDGLHSEMF